MTSTLAARQSGSQSPRNPLELQAPKAIFWAGLIVRLAYITLAHTYKVSRYEDHFEFGWEAARIARSLATGHGYADPFIQGGTGPTAWLPPLFPLLIAGCFKLFGAYTPLAGWAVLALNSLFSAATAPATYEIGACCFNRKVALWSGWLWALYPAAMQYSVKWVWEMCLTTMLFTWALVLTLRMRGVGEDANDGRDRQSWHRWLLFALLWALIGLSNPSVLLMLPVSGIWVLMGAPDLKRSLLKATAAGLLFFACLTPWAYRNWRVFHALIPMRGNFGAEFYLGNNRQALGLGWGVSIVSHKDYADYERLGEVAYVKRQSQLAKQEIKAYPNHFLLLCVKRFYFFWASVPHPMQKSPFLEYVREFHYGFLSITGIFGLVLALRRGVPGVSLFAWAFALIPITYYFVTVGARFRHPLEPLIAVLTVYLFQSTERRRSGTQAG